MLCSEHGKKGTTKCWHFKAACSLGSSTTAKPTLAQQDRARSPRLSRLKDPSQYLTVSAFLYGSLHKKKKKCALGTHIVIVWLRIKPLTKTKWRVCCFPDETLSEFQLHLSIARWRWGSTCCRGLFHTHLHHPVPSSNLGTIGYTRSRVFPYLCLPCCRA